MRTLALALALTLIGCGSSDEPAQTTPADTGATQFASIKVKVRYAGMKKGQLAVAAFVENPPKSKPPVSFDTAENPTFPRDLELRGLEPGTYWVAAVLDAEPYGTGGTKPGPEDIQVMSEAITITGTETKSVEVTLTDTP